MALGLLIGFGRCPNCIYMKSLVFFLVLLAGCPVFAQGQTNQPAPPDSHLRLAAIKAKCDTALGKLSGTVENFEDGIRYSRLGLAQTGKDDVLNQANFALMAGVSYYSLMRFDSAALFFAQALQAAGDAKNAELINASAGALLILNLQTGKATIQNNTLLGIINATIDSSKDIRAQQKGYNSLGNYYYIKSFYTTAQDFYQRSIYLNEQMADTAKDILIKKELAVQYYNLSKIYLSKKLFRNALEALTKGSKYKNSSALIDRRYNAAYVDVYTTGTNAHIDTALYYYRLLEAKMDSTAGIVSENVTSNLSLAQYYISKGQLNKALPYLRLAESRSATSKSPFLLHQAQHLGGRYAYLEGDYKKAIRLLEQSLPVSASINKDNYLEGVHYLAKAYNAYGDMNASRNYYELYIATKDTLNSDEQMRLYADMEIRYRTKEKEQLIASMTTVQKLNELELKNARRQRYIFIVSLSALGIISLLIYRLYLLKEKHNRLLNGQNYHLDQLNHKLAIANESKARLLGIFSHDLRAPIGRIAQYLSLQKEQPDLFSEEKSQAYHLKFTAATSDLLRTMEDLVVWSKSQMEHFSPEMTSVQIKPVIDEKINFFRELIEDKNISVHNTIDPTLTLRTDINYLSIILRNLLQNALKYGTYQSELLLEFKYNKLCIYNTTYHEMNAQNFQEIMKGQTQQSRSNGMGLQLAMDLAGRLDFQLYFEIKDMMVCTILEWPDK